MPDRPATIENRPATNVTASSAWMNGYLVSTGTLPVIAVSVYWGATDGGDPTSGLWQATNALAGGSWTNGAYLTYQATGLTANGFYYYRYYATNSFGDGWSLSSERFLAGNLTVTAPDATAAEPPPDGVATNLGTLSIQRDPAATNDALTVNYAWAGTSVMGGGFTPSPAGTSVTLPAGVASTNIAITPLWDPTWTADTPSKSVWLVLQPGAYGIGTPASNAVTIERYPFTPGANVTTNSGDWNNGTIWSQGRRPLPGDDVTVQHAVTVTNATDYLNSLTIATNGTLVCSNWNTIVQAATITVNGALTLPAAFTNNQMSNRVYVICTDFTLAPGAIVNADGKGFASDNGPGRGAAVDNGGGGGGAYGGRGGGGYQGWSFYPDRAGAPYGLATNPAAPGSGGGQNTGGWLGGNGGGAVRIMASGTVTIDGTITACGTLGAGEYGGTRTAGAGAGGGIWITCATVGGTGSVLADGGAPQQFGQAYGYMQGGGGGGGRIAISYNPSAQATQPVPFIQCSARGGANPGLVYFPWYGDLGTVSFPDAQLLNGLAFSDSGELVIPGFTEWAENTLAISNVWLRIPVDGFRLTVTNDFAFKGAANRISRMELTNATVTCGGSMSLTSADLMLSGGSSGSSIICGGDLILNNSTLTHYFPLTTTGAVTVSGTMTLTNASACYLYSGMTNGISPDYGGLVQVGRDVMIATNCWIYPYSDPTNGGSVFFRVRNLTVTTPNAGINANGLGYSCPLKNNANGNGPGKGQGGFNATGGGYGGLGGKALPGFGQTYGSSNAPVDAGSAGGQSTSIGGDFGGAGGGVVRIDASGTVSVNGTLTANGTGDENGQNNYGGGGGAGGSIYIKCRKFTGNNPVFSASGGVGCDDRNTAGSGGGGGGRIAVWRMMDTTVGVTTNVVGGAGYREGTPGGSGVSTGAVGTVVWGQLAMPGTIISLW